MRNGPEDDAKDRPAALKAAPEGTQEQGSKAPLAIFFMILAISLFSGMDALAKWMGESYPTMQLVFFRNWFGFLPLLFLIWKEGGLRPAFRITRWDLHFVRSLFGLLALITFFYCVSRMKLADLIAITFVAPLFITALSVPLLGERVGIRRWVACLFGFCGVLIMLRPGGDLWSYLSLVALSSAVFYSLAVILVRKLSRSDSNASIIMTFTVGGALVSSAFMPFQWVTPSLSHLPYLIAIGLLGGTAQIFITYAFRLSELSRLAPFEYLGLLWAAFFGFWFWGEVPMIYTWIGSLFIIAAGLYIVYRETHLAREGKRTARKQDG